MANKIIIASLIGLVSALFFLAIGMAGWLDRWEYTTWSWRVQLFMGPGPATHHIKLILLDQASLDWGARENGLSWPWPRELYAPIVNFCKRGDARALAFDVLYTEPSVYGVSDDLALGAAIQEYGRFAGALFLGSADGRATWPETPSPPCKVIVTDPALSQILTVQQATFPIPEVSTNAAILANVRGVPDSDGTFRRATPLNQFDDKWVPALGLAPYLLTHNTPMDLEPGRLAIGDSRIPHDHKGRMILRYRGGTDVFDTFSAAAIIQSELRLLAGEQPVVSPGVFKDAYVFFGFSAPGLMDLRSTPLKGVAPGVLIYATMLDNLLSSQAIHPMHWGTAGFFILLVSMLGSWVVILCRRIWLSIIGALFGLLIASGIPFFAYVLGWWIPMVVPASAFFMAVLIAYIYNYATEGRQKAFIKSAFRHYLNPTVIDRILVDPSKLQLGGERRTLTIFFSDLQGFSSFSEKLEPEALTALLNAYLTDMTDIILEEGGTLDKYEGDAIMAFWNAPLEQDNHAELACRAAIRCQEKLAEKRQEYMQKAGVELHARIGINSGEVVVGNMGSKRRFDYTVLGDAANLASRLEGANKAFGTYCMIPEETQRECGRTIRTRYLGRIRVVGRSQPVPVFELLTRNTILSDEDCLRFKEGIERCERGDWTGALDIFDSYPDDSPAMKYVERCRVLLDQPGQSWDGIWNLREK